MGATEHRHKAEEHPVRCAVLVISDSVSATGDTSGERALYLIQKAGHQAVRHKIVPNDPDEIRKEVAASLADADAVVAIGGTGPSRKDITIETLRPLLAKELPGFGELFRAKSAAEIGTAAILSRAMLGVTAEGKVIACTPGSTAAVKVALEDVLLPELKHLVWDVRRYR
jgi:molybdenum cofactor biosynthesis protein B